MDVDYYLKGGKKSVLVFALIIIQLPFMSVVLYTHTHTHTCIFACVVMLNKNLIYTCTIFLKDSRQSGQLLDITEFFKKSLGQSKRHT